MPAKTQPKTQPKAKGGRPKGASTTYRAERERLKRKVAELEAKLEAKPAPVEAPPPAGDPGPADPFAEPVKGVVEGPAHAPAPPSASAGQETPSAAPPPELPDDAVPPMPGAPPSAPVAPTTPGKRRMGEDQAATVFGILCTLYDEGFSEPFAVLVVRSKLEAMNDKEAARALWAQIAALSRLSDADRATLAPPIVRRLAELEVDDDFDLWFALLVVFGTKFILMRTLASNPEAAAQMDELFRKVRETRASPPTDDQGGPVVDITPTR